MRLLKLSLDQRYTESWADRLLNGWRKDNMLHPNSHLRAWLAIVQCLWAEGGKCVATTHMGLQIHWSVPRRTGRCSECRRRDWHNTHIVLPAAPTPMCNREDVRPGCLVHFPACAIIEQLTKRNIPCFVKLCNIHTHRQNAKQKSKQLFCTWFWGRCTPIRITGVLSEFIKSRDNYVSETGSVSILRREDTYSVVPLR
jgi:hypothetical protein